MLASCTESADAPVPPISADVIGGNELDIKDVTLKIVSSSTAEATGDDYPYSRTLATIRENQSWVVTLIASDGRGGTVALSLSDSGNGDSEAFSFDTDTGEFRLREPQNFEKPIDHNQDNTFEMVMIAHEYPNQPSIAFEIDISNMTEVFDNKEVIRFGGETAFRGLGRHAANLGDIDGDGQPELMIAAPGQHYRDRGSTFPPEGSEHGAVYIVPGALLIEADTLEMLESDSNGVLKIDGVEGDLHFGYSWAVIGDLDGDGINDFVTARNETELNIISGASLASVMQAGGTVSLDEIPHATAITPNNYYVDPLSLGAMGDMTADGLPELAVCMRRGDYRVTTGLLHAAVLVTGAPLKDALEQNNTILLDDVIRAKQAGGYYRPAIGQAFCGPLETMGDVDGDGLNDVSINLIDWNESAAIVFSGQDLLNSLNFGSIRNSRWNSLIPATHIGFWDSQVPTVTNDRIITPLGDINSDGFDDFAFGWLFFQDSDNLDLDSAFIVYGHDTILDLDGHEREVDLRSLQAQGNAVLLDGPSGVDKLTALSALLPPEDGQHEALIMARQGTYNARTVHTVSADELPTGGTPTLSVPVAGAGSMIVPAGHRENQSRVISIGDLNDDGYGDLLIGQDTTRWYGREDAGLVYLISGQLIFEARARGETFDPAVAYAEQ
jgi:hypothetical protein